MTDCGCLANARNLQREVVLAASVPGRLARGLARWRAGRPLDDGDAMILFGVGLATIQRIERGEVEPEPELAERIARAIGLSPAPHSEASAHGVASVSPAIPTAGSEGGAAVISPLLVAAAPLADEASELGPLVPIPPPSPALAKADDGTFHVGMFLGRYCVLEMEIAEAEQLAGELRALVALTRDPTLYDKQPRLARPSTEES